MKRIESLLSAEELAALLGSYGEGSDDEQLDNESELKQNQQECDSVFTKEDNTIPPSANSH